MEEDRDIAKEIEEGLKESIRLVKGEETKGRVTYLLAGQEFVFVPHR